MNDRGRRFYLFLLACCWFTEACACEDAFTKRPVLSEDYLPLEEMFARSAETLVNQPLASDPSVQLSHFSEPGALYLFPQAVVPEVIQTFGVETPYTAWLENLSTTHRIRFNFRPLKTFHGRLLVGLLLTPHQRPDFPPFMLSVDPLLSLASTRLDAEHVERQLKIGEHVIVRRHFDADFSDPLARESWKTPAMRAQTLKLLKRMELAKASRLPLNDIQIDVESMYPHGLRTMGTYMGRHSDGRARVKTRIPFAVTPHRYMGRPHALVQSFESILIIPREFIEPVRAKRFSVLGENGARERMKMFGKNRMQLDLTSSFTYFPERGPLASGPIQPTTGRRFKIETLEGEVIARRNQLIPAWTESPRRVELQPGNPFAEIRPHLPIVYTLQRQAAQLLAFPDLKHADLQEQLRVLVLWTNRLFLKHNRPFTGRWTEGTPSITEALSIGEANPIQKAAFLGAILELLGARVTVEYLAPAKMSPVPFEEVWLRAHIQNKGEYFIESDPPTGLEPLIVSREDLEKSLAESEEERPEHRFLRSGIRRLEFVEVRN